MFVIVKQARQNEMYFENLKMKNKSSKQSSRMSTTILIIIAFFFNQWQAHGKNDSKQCFLGFKN